MVNYITSPDLCHKYPGVYEPMAYSGTAGDATTLDITRVDLVDEGNRRVHQLGRAPVLIGDRFIRRVWKWDEATGAFLGTPEPWLRVTAEEYATFVVVVPKRDKSSAPGDDPMKDPLGCVIWVDDDGDGKNGAKPVHPISGQPERERWFGALTRETVP